MSWFHIYRAKKLNPHTGETAATAADQLSDQQPINGLIVSALKVSEEEEWKLSAEFYLMLNSELSSAETQPAQQNFI